MAFSSSARIRFYPLHSYGHIQAIARLNAHTNSQLHAGCCAVFLCLRSGLSREITTSPKTMQPFRCQCPFFWNIRAFFRGFEPDCGKDKTSVAHRFPAIVRLIRLIPASSVISMPISAGCINRRSTEFPAHTMRRLFNRTTRKTALHVSLPCRPNKFRRHTLPSGSSFFQRAGNLFISGYRCGHDKSRPHKQEGLRDGFKLFQGNRRVVKLSVLKLPLMSLEPYAQYFRKWAS